MLIGGAAMTAHGSAYITYDLDICYARTPQNFRRLAEALQPFHPRLRGAPPGLPFRWDAETIRRGLNFTLTTDAGDIDLLGEVAGLRGYAEAKRMSQVLELYGANLDVLSLEGLIRTKRAAGRSKDKLALPELEALKELKRKGNL